MAVSMLILMVPAILLLLAGLFALLMHEKTRPVGLVLLALPLGLLALRFGGRLFAGAAAIGVTSWAALGLIVLVLFILAGLVAVGSLFSNEKTRPLALGILGGGALLALLVGVAVFGLFAVRVEQPAWHHAGVHLSTEQIGSLSDSHQAKARIHGKKAHVAITLGEETPPPKQVSETETPDPPAPEEPTPSETPSPPEAGNDPIVADKDTSGSEETTDTVPEEPGTLTRFGKMLRSLVSAIDAELPEDINEDDAISALEKTVEEELPEEVEDSALIRALGKAVGRAIAERHEGLAAARQAAEGGSPSSRPGWIEMRPRWSDGVYRMATTVGPYTTRLECDKNLPRQLEQVTAEYASAYLGLEAQGRARLAPEFLREQVVRETWEETRQSMVGPMIQLHVLLEYDSKANAQLKQAWHEAQIRQRLGYAGAGLLGTLTVLVIAFFYLKLDEATSGAYRIRLGLVACVGLLAVVAAVLFAVELDWGYAAGLERPSVRLPDPPLVVPDSAASAHPVKTASRAMGASGEAVMVTRWSILGVFPLLVVSVPLLAFKKTRGVGKLLLAVVAVGALLLIA